MTGTHETNASGDEQTHNRPPRTRQVALALDRPPERLTEFVECHPNPTVEALLALSDRPPADAETRDMLSRWIDATDTDPTPIEDRPGGDPAGLIGGGQ